MTKGTILYVGGFQLPDKNAAAFRVIANAKAFRTIGYRVVFLNALLDIEKNKRGYIEYEGFECFEYKREGKKEYSLSSKRIISVLKEIKAQIVVAYNHPAVALNKLRKYCQRHQIKCYADVTEWYVPAGNPVFRLIKGFDTEFRMKYVHPRLDGIIAISEYLYEYYKDKVKTVKIPPLVDLEEEKWKGEEKIFDEGIKLIYAGAPSRQKERLDLIVKAIGETRKDRKLYLEVIGITKEQYKAMYKHRYPDDRVIFHGRVVNSEVIKMIKGADYTVILRKKNKVVQAGFPTKVTESISCGTPIIANCFSNIGDYLDKSNSILMNSIEDIIATIKEVEKRSYKVDKSLFDYRKYLDLFKRFID